MIAKAAQLVREFAGQGLGCLVPWVYGQGTRDCVLEENLCQHLLLRAVVLGLHHGSFLVDVKSHGSLGQPTPVRHLKPGL